MTEWHVQNLTFIVLLQNYKSGQNTYSNCLQGLHNRPWPLRKGKHMRELFLLGKAFQTAAQRRGALTGSSRFPEKRWRKLEHGTAELDRMWRTGYQIGKKCYWTHYRGLIRSLVKYWDTYPEDETERTLPEKSYWGGGRWTKISKATQYWTTFQFARVDKNCWMPRASSWNFTKAIS